MSKRCEIKKDTSDNNIKTDRIYIELESEYVFIELNGIPIIISISDADDNYINISFGNNSSIEVLKGEIVWMEVGSSGMNRIEEILSILNK